MKSVVSPLNHCISCSAIKDNWEAGHNTASFIFLPIVLRWYNQGTAINDRRKRWAFRVKISTTVLRPGYFEDVSFPPVRWTYRPSRCQWWGVNLYEYCDRYKNAAGWGRVEWSKYVTVGYLDQHAVLEQVNCPRCADSLCVFKTEARINESMSMGWGWADGCPSWKNAMQDRLEARISSYARYQDWLIARALDYSMEEAMWQSYRTGLRFSWPFWKTGYPALGQSQPTIWMRSTLTSSSVTSKTINAFVLISHDIPFLNDVISYRLPCGNQQLTRYFWGLLPILRSLWNEKISAGEQLMSVSRNCRPQGLCSS